MEAQSAGLVQPARRVPVGQQDRWWQGENVRIASLATAARLVAQDTGGQFAAELEQYDADQLNWICGLNPYAPCMLNGGRGRAASANWSHREPAMQPLVL